MTELRHLQLVILGIMKDIDALCVKNNIEASVKKMLNINIVCIGKIKENFFISEVKKYNSPLEASLFADNIDKKVYLNLIDAIHSNINLMYDYMNIRKKFLNYDEMHMWDIYVDIIDVDNKDIDFEEGKKIIFEALKPLGEEYLQDAKKWLDLGIVDQIEPMVYSSDSLFVQNKIEYYQENLNEDDFRIGIGNNISLLDLCKQIYYTDDNGVVIFSSSEYLKNRYVDILTMNHHLDVVSCINSSQEITQAIINDLIDKIAK